MMYCSRCSSYKCECEDYPIETEIRDLKITIQSLEQEVARLKEENLRIRNCMSCKHSSMLGNCLHPNHPATLNCRCNLWEIKK